MTDLMEIARRARDANRKESSISKKSPAAHGTTDPFLAYPAYLPLPWDGEHASRAMFNADSLVEHLGANGLHPEVQSAADKVVRANRARDATAFAVAITEFEAVVRRVGVGGGDILRL